MARSVLPRTLVYLILASRLYCDAWGLKRALSRTARYELVPADLAKKGQGACKEHMREALHNVQGNKTGKVF